MCNSLGVLRVLIPPCSGESAAGAPPAPRRAPYAARQAPPVAAQRLTPPPAEKGSRPTGPIPTRYKGKSSKPQHVNH
eukprot:6972088-Pyramimonas_sp.AAC.1